MSVAGRRVQRRIERRWERGFREAGAQPWVAREIVSDALSKHGPVEGFRAVRQILSYVADGPGRVINSPWPDPTPVRFRWSQ